MPIIDTCIQHTTCQVHDDAPATERCSIRSCRGRTLAMPHGQSAALNSASRGTEADGSPVTESSLSLRARAKSPVAGFDSVVLGPGCAGRGDMP